MITRLKQIFARRRGSAGKAGFRFSRPLVLFQSDDWGRAGIRDREGWDELKTAGINLGEKPYDFYSLETAGDLQALSEVLHRHQDAVGRHPCIGMNFITANVDFPRLEVGGEKVPLYSLVDGWPHPWQRPGLLEAYHQGIRVGVFFPALHGLTHFCAAAVTRELANDGEHQRLLRTLWHAGTPYIQWRMPWIGYEYWDPSLAREKRFLSLPDQRAAIRRAAEIYRALFAAIPLSACAPGYRSNEDTQTAWFEAGVRVVQGGPDGLRRPYLDEKGMLLTFRNVEMEPATAPCELESIVKQAGECFERGIPAVVSIHSLNFHSTLKDFRTPTLGLLDGFLTAIRKRWPDVLYVHDGDLWNITTQGFLASEAGKIQVGVTTAGAEA